MQTKAARIRKIQEVWRERFDADLTEEDARQVLDSAVRFFSLLQDWDRRRPLAVVAAEWVEQHSSLPAGLDKVAAGGRVAA